MTSPPNITPPSLARRHREATRRIGKLYSWLGSRYDGLITARVLPLVVRGGRETVAQWVRGQQPAAPVLDLPTGTGEYLGLLPAPAVGVDLARGMLEAASARHRNAVLVQGDAFCLPFPDGAFATVVTILGLHLLPRPAAVVPEMARVLRPGGILLGAVPLLSPYVPTPRAFRRILDVAGLEVEVIERRRLLVVFRARVVRSGSA